MGKGIDKSKLNRKIRCKGTVALGKQNLSTVCPKDNKYRYSNYNYFMFLSLDYVTVGDNVQIHLYMNILKVILIYSEVNFCKFCYFFGFKEQCNIVLLLVLFS